MEDKNLKTEEPINPECVRCITEGTRCTECKISN